MKLELEAKKLVNYINSLDLNISPRKPSHEHLGAIIADAVLQIGHKYKEQVSNRVEDIITNYPQANTVSGFLNILKQVGAQKLLSGWKGHREHKRLNEHAMFFASKGVDTFNELCDWLQDDNNRDSLIEAGLGIRDKTADYYRVLVRLPDAVKVDSQVEEFLADAGIDVTHYAYKEKRTIIQLAAKQLGKRPLDLDGAIWNFQDSRNDKGGDMVKNYGFTVKQAEQFSLQRGYVNEVQIINGMTCPLDWKPDWFRYAKRGNYLLMWRWNKGNSYPLDKNPPSDWLNRQVNWFNKYITQQAGIDWQKTNNPYWLKRGEPTEGQEELRPIIIKLLPDQRTRLEKLADEFGEKPEILAKIWILERLRQLS